MTQKYNFRRGKSMSVQEITTDQLRRMEGKEGLILQGCGGSLLDWRNGINKLLTEARILKNGTQFETVYAFQHEGTTCLLFPLEGSVELDVGKLAMWRLQSHSTFGGTWLSDYVPNRLGGFLREQEVSKPECPLIGQDGNIFNLVGIASRTLREHGLSQQAKEMTQKVFECSSYEEAVNVLGEYVTITSSQQEEQMDLRMQ